MKNKGKTSQKKSTAQNATVSARISARRRSEDALRESEEKFRALVETSYDWIWAVDEDGVYTYASPRVKDILGYSEAEVVGKTPFDFMPPMERERVVGEFGKIMVNREPLVALENINRHRDGREVILETSGMPVFDPRGRFKGYRGIDRDVTERKHAEAVLRISEERFRKVFMTSPDSINITRLEDGMIISINRGFTATTGYTEADAVGRTSLELNIWVDHADRQKLVEGLRKQGEVKNLEARFRIKDGRIIDGLMSASIVEIDRIPHIISVTRDITERKRYELALRENQARLDLALQSAHMGVWRWEIKENRRYFDDLTCQVLGIDAAKFHGDVEDFHRAVHPEDREKVKAALARTLDLDVPYEPSYRVVWPDGSIHYITSRGRLFRDDKRQPVRFNGILWDVTDQRRLEQELIETEKLESIGTLAGGIAHDFNNLLQGVFGFISMAKLTFDQKEKSLAMLTQAEKALHQSVNLTSQLLTFSKGGKPVKKVFALRPLIENSVAFALSGSRVTYEIVIDENLRAVEADEGQIGQVIQNIVLNADQAMPLGGMIRVSIRNTHAAAVVPPTDLQGDLVEISIRDQGTGIPADHMTRIFDPYFTTKEKGSGLGLATSYSIIKNHGGLIRVQSEVGKGTTFFIYLPASAANREETDRSAIPALTRTGRILVMDDEEMIRTVAGELLTTAGHEVAFAEKGETALEVYRAARDAGHPFDVVILDLTIRGGMGGREALRQLMEIDPDVKAVVSSGYSDDAALSNYREQGFKAFLKKPYSIEELQSTLNALFS